MMIEVTEPDSRQISLGTTQRELSVSSIFMEGNESPWTATISVCVFGAHLSGGVEQFNNGGNGMSSDCPRGFMQKKKKIIMRPFFDKLKLCKIAPKIAMIMQTVQ